MGIGVVGLKAREEMHTFSEEVKLNLFGGGEVKKLRTV